MSSQRQKIRKAVHDLLVNQGPWDDRVMLNRPNPLSQRPHQQSGRQQTPAVLIYTGAEDAQIFNESPREYLRTVDLVIQVAEAMNDTIDDTLDDYAVTIENLLLADDTLGPDPGDPTECVAADVRLARSTLTIVDEGELPIGAISMVFEVDYYTSHAQAITDPFEIADIRYNVAGEQEQDDEAHDTVYPDQ